MSGRLRFGILFAWLICVAAMARDPEGHLALLKTPNEGMPVITVPGAIFEVTAQQQAELRLIASDPNTPPIALSVEWLPAGSLLVAGHCTVPPSILPGTYALEATVEGKIDRNVRSVYVRSSFPDAYGFAHLTDVHVGRTGTIGQPGSAVLKAALSTIVADAQKAKAMSQSVPAASTTDEKKPPVLPEVAFVAITGDLTQDGTPEQFREFLDALNTSVLPTFVCPGNHDKTDDEYARVYGPLNYAFRFGQDGYLVFDTKDFMIADDAGSEAATVALQRRALRDCRWTIGLTHRYDASMGMRLQLAILVDDPIDWLVYGHEHKANGPDRRATPWGVPITVTPALVDGVGRLIMVLPQGIKPTEPQPVAGVTPPTKK